MKKETEIGSITNYYGGLLVAEQDGKFYFGIDSFEPTLWEEISEDLYKELLKHNANNN
jgi:hypothetical protein